MKRVFLFAVTNMAVLAVIYVVLNIFGVDQVLARNGSSLNLGNLLVFSAVVGFSGSLISLAMSKWLAKMSTGARVIDTPRNSAESWLVNTVYRHADAANIRRPQVAIYDSPDVNAFATGPTRNNALVAVSSGLLQRLGQREVEAVLGHEITHVANGDMVTLTLLQGVLNTFVVFLSRIVGFVVDRVLLRNERGGGAGFFIASLVASDSARRFGQHDRDVVLAAARVPRRCRWSEAGWTPIDDQRVAGPAACAPTGSVTRSVTGVRHRGWPAGGLRRLFMSHPPLEERIAALQRAE